MIVSNYCFLQAYFYFRCQYWKCRQALANIFAILQTLESCSKSVECIHQVKQTGEPMHFLAGPQAYKLYVLVICTRLKKRLLVYELTDIIAVIQPLRQTNNLFCDLIKLKHKFISDKTKLFIIVSIIS